MSNTASRLLKVATLLFLIATAFLTASAATMGPGNASEALAVPGVVSIFLAFMTGFAATFPYED